MTRSSPENKFCVWISRQKTLRKNKACTKFEEHYSENIELEFKDEMLQFKYLILHSEDAGKDTIVPVQELYKLIFGNMTQSTFPIVLTAVQIYRNLMITNSTSEPNFSKLNPIKKCPRLKTV